MDAIGGFFAGLGWPLNLLIMALFLGIVWLMVRFSKKLKPYTGQIMVLASIFWVGLVFFFLTYAFPTPRFPMATDATTVPRFWFYVLLPTILLALYPILKGKEKPDPKWGNIRLVLSIIALLITSIFLFEYLGYYLSSAIFIVGSMWLLGARKKIELVAMPIGWALFSHFVFANLLNVRLPIGRIFEGIL